MKTAIFLLTLFLTLSLSTAQVTQQWVQNYNGILDLNDVGSFITVDGSGNVYVTGLSYGINGNNCVIETIKYNTAGTQLWISQYGNLVTSYNRASGIVVDDNGNVYVAATAFGSDNYTHPTVIKYNSAGIQQWAVQYSYIGSTYDGATGIALDGQGNIFISGNIQGVGFNQDIAAIKYNSNGILQWAHVYNGTSNGDDLASSIAVDVSGNVFITGFTEGIGGNSDYITIKYSNSGTLQWASKYDGPANGIDIASGITTDGSGNSYITGFSAGTDGYKHCATVKYNSSGAQQWVQRFNGGGNGDDYGTKILFKGGSVYVTGNVQGVGTGKDYLTIKYSPSGNPVWANAYDGPAHGRDESTAIGVDDYDDIYVTGYSKGTDGITHMATVRYNSNGSQQWVQRYNSGQCSGYIDEGALGIAIGPTGGVYVTGFVTHVDNNCSSNDYCTIKYTQTGLGVTTVTGTIPKEYSLQQNYPNPFNPATNINFGIPKAGNVRIVIYDLLGREVAELINEYLRAGNYKADFDGSGLSSGTYFYRITAGEFTNVKKMILIR